MAKSLNFTPTTNHLSICSRNHVYHGGMHVGWTNWLHTTLPLCTYLAKHMLLLTHCRAFLMARALQLLSQLLLYPAPRVGNSTWILDGFRNTIMLCMCVSIAMHGFEVSPPVLALSLVSRWSVLRSRFWNGFPAMRTSLACAGVWLLRSNCTGNRSACNVICS